jgi:hypothetical protein
VDLAAESVRALVDSRRAAQFVDPGMLAAAKRDIEAMERRASHVAPERAAHYLRKAQAARAFLERCTTQRRTGRSSYWVMRDAQYHRLARALDHLASAIPPIIGHLGTLRLLDRRALVLGERTVMYAPEGRVSWDLSYLPLPRPLDLDELDL